MSDLTVLGVAYRLDGDRIVCRRCRRAQQVTWRDHAFPHQSGCRHDDADPHPWISLVHLINTAPKSMGQP